MEPLSGFASPAIQITRSKFQHNYVEMNMPFHTHRLCGEVLLALSILWIASGCSASLPKLAQEGRLRALQEKVAGGADINTKDKKGNTALILAVKQGQGDMVTYLLSAGAAVNERNHIGDNALAWAVAKGPSSLIKELLDQGADFNNHDTLGNTPLMIAASLGHYSDVNTLLQAGAYAQAKTKSGFTALGCSIYSSNCEVVELLLQTGCDCNGKYMYRAELQSFLRGPVKEIEYNTGIITISPVFGVKTGKSHYYVPTGYKINYGTLLHVAVRRNYLDIAKLLLEHEANVNIKDTDGMTPLMRAAAEGSLDMAKLLLEHDAKCGSFILNSQGKSTLDLARENNHPDMVELLQSYN
jgi:ankyrin repeat protein